MHPCSVRGVGHGEVPKRPSWKLPGRISCSVSACQEWASRKPYASAKGTTSASVEMMREVICARGATVICRDITEPMSWCKESKMQEPCVRLLSMHPLHEQLPGIFDRR